MAGEIQNTEKRLEIPGISGAEKREALIRLARLFRLSGNLEGAALAWTDAAFAEPGSRDDGALLEGARLLTALGEYDKAEAGVKTVLLTGRDRELVLQARYLGAQLEAFKTGNVHVLSLLTGDPDYAELRPSLYYTLWKVSGDGSYKDRLLAEYPQSPEARIVKDGGDAISGAPSAMWLLLPGRAGFTLETPAGGLRQAPLNTVQARTSGSDAGAAAQSSPAQEAALLQAGLFGKEGNAQALAERLRNAGFAPAVSRRELNGTLYWAVNVPPGTDMTQTIMRLKDAGFESFPVF
jgi:hypothetical protein